MNLNTYFKRDLLPRFKSWASAYVLAWFFSPCSSTLSASHLGIEGKYFPSQDALFKQHGCKSESTQIFILIFFSTYVQICQSNIQLNYLLFLFVRSAHANNPTRDAINPNPGDPFASSVVTGNVSSCDSVSS